MNTFSDNFLDCLERNGWQISSYGKNKGKYYLKIFNKSLFVEQTVWVDDDLEEDYIKGIIDLSYDFDSEEYFAELYDGCMNPESVQALLDKANAISDSLDYLRIDLEYLEN